MLEEGELAIRICWRKPTNVVAAFFAVIFGFALACTSVRASESDVDIAVDAAVTVGSIAGVPIDPSDGAIIKTIVQCALNNDLVRCARQEILDQLPLPPEARPVSQCILNEQPLDQCGINAAPAELRPLLVCLSQRRDVGRCGEQAALSVGQQKVFSVIDKLKADARSEGASELSDATSGSMRNIVGLVQALQRNDWVGVFNNGGPEIYKAAAKVVLNAVLGPLPPFNQLASPVIDAIVQARFDVVAKVIANARSKNVKGVASAITEAYLVNFVVVPCSLPLIPDDVKDAVCGPLGTIIHKVADARGSVAAFVIDLIKDSLGKAVDAFLDDVKHILQGKSTDCATPQQYYAGHYLKCYHRGVFQFSTAHIGVVKQSLNAGCRKEYGRCFLQSHIGDMCEPQNDRFADDVNRLAVAVNSSAGRFVNSFAQFVRDKGKAAACNPAAFKQHFLTEFVQLCAAGVARQVPLNGDPSRDDCDMGSSSLSAPVAQTGACQTAMAGQPIDAILRSVCGPPPKPRPPTGCHEIAEGRCGTLALQCDAPLPAEATDFTITGLNNAKVGSADRTGGSVTVDYSSTGDFAIEICSLNQEVGACGATFQVSLGSPIDHTCFGSGGHRQICPSNLKLCHNACVGKNTPCPQIQ
jgi:hypothetical protein